MTNMRLLFACLAAFAAGCEPALEAAGPEAEPGNAGPATAAAGPGDVEYIAGPGMENLDLPFSAAVRVGNTLYLSGMIGSLLAQGCPPADAARAALYIGAMAGRAAAVRLRSRIR